MSAILIGRCLNCRRLKQIHLLKRCAKCYRYLKRTGQERPYWLQRRGEQPAKAKPMCDCGHGRVAHTITVRYGRSGRMKAGIRVCDRCYELETT